MAKRGCACGLCEINSPPAACTGCVNLRLAEKYKLLRRKLYERDVLRRRLDAELKAKREADVYQQWRLEHAERRTKLLACLEKSERLLVQNKQRYEKRKSEYDARKRLLDTAAIQLHRRKKEFLEQFYPDLIRAQVLKLTSFTSDLNKSRKLYFRHLMKIYSLSYVQGDSADTHALRICGACLPIRDDIYSVSVEDLSASLGHMTQLVRQTARILSAPLLHITNFGASSSRILIRSSYWDSTPSEEYPLFRKGKSSSEASSKAESSGSRFLKPKFLRGKVVSPDSNQSEGDRDVRQGLRVLKRSISCISAYGFNVILRRPPSRSNMSTFETFMELLSILAAKKQKPRLQRPVMLSNAEDIRSDEGSMTQSQISSRSSQENEGQGKSRVDISDFSCIAAADVRSLMWSRGGESSVEEWDVVDHPVLPPPSQDEDVEHWTRAMITDATK